MLSLRRSSASRRGPRVPHNLSVLFFFFPLFLSSVPLAHILHYDYLDDPTGVTWEGGAGPSCGTYSPLTSERRSVVH